MIKIKLNIYYFSVVKKQGVNKFIKTIDTISTYLIASYFVFGLFIVRYFINKDISLYSVLFYMFFIFCFYKKIKFIKNRNTKTEILINLCLEILLLLLLPILA